MKRALAILVVSLATLLLAKVGVAEPAADRMVAFHVEGMTCPLCAKAIEKKLHALDGVERIETNIAEGVVIVSMKEGTTLDETKAKQAVEDAGFTLKAFGKSSSGDRN